MGGNGGRVLRFAARHADIVGITGLGRTLADGHRHEVDWSHEAIGRTIETIRSGTGDGRAQPEIEVLVQAVVVADDAAAAARRLTEHFPGASVDDLLEAPFVWLGTVDEIARQLHQTTDDLGISRYVIRPPAMADARAILRVMAGD